jgi:hypothetical protein
MAKKPVPNLFRDLGISVCICLGFSWMRPSVPGTLPRRLLGWLLGRLLGCLLGGILKGAGIEEAFPRRLACRGANIPHRTPLADRRCRFAVAPPPQHKKPIAAFESARVQPFKCSQQVTLGFRSVSAPLRLHFPLLGFSKPYPQTKTLNPKLKQSPPPATGARPSPKPKT